jgi:hypothetical protein
MLTDEELWAGDFGIQYTTRFNVEWRDRIPFMRQLLGTTGARSILDVGTNAAWNLRALRDVDASLELRGVEINPWVAKAAATMLFEIHIGPAKKVGEQWPEWHDLVMTSGVLIHVPPDLLEETMRSIAQASRRWVLAIEYAAEEETVRVRHGGVPRTWGRPYGALYEALGLKLHSHGPANGYVDCEWWLLQK